MSAAQADELVHYAVKDRICTLTLNRSHRLNAFSDELVVALAAGLRRFDQDNDAWLAIIHGSGRAFSTGADVHQRQLRSRAEFEKFGGPQAHGAHASELLINSRGVQAAVAAQQVL